MKRIKTYKQLHKIQKKEHIEAQKNYEVCIDEAFEVYEGFIIIIARNNLDNFKKGIYFITAEDFAEWDEEDQIHFNYRYFY